MLFFTWMFLSLGFILVIGSLGYYWKIQENNKIVSADLNTEVSSQPLTVNGQIPAWLLGSFIRNGPISFKINDKEIPHWFDGLAMLHGFYFKNGQVLYSNQFLRTDPYKEVFEKGNLNFGGFSTPDRKSLFEKVFSFFKPSNTYLNNANVNVAEIGNHYVALTETPLPVSFELTTLNTLAAFNYPDPLPKKDAFESAHPKVDYKTKEMFNYLIKYGKDTYYIVYRLNNLTGARETIAQIPTQKPAYMHSFALTSNYIILVEFPFKVDPFDLILSRKGYISSFTWMPSQGTDFIIIDRKTGEITKINYPKAFFAFHHVNAYQQNNNIILDIITYPDASVIADVAQHGDLKPNIKLEKKLYKNMEDTKFLRFTISMSDHKIVANELLKASIEFPRINENYNALAYRYVYVVDPRDALNENDLRPISKIDLTTNEKIEWAEKGVMPGEPVFIANPNGTSEDDGIIMTIVLDNHHHKGFLLLLDAKTLQEVARCYTPFAIPIGLHGQFWPSY